LTKRHGGRKRTRDENAALRPLKRKNERGREVEADDIVTQDTFTEQVEEDLGSWLEFMSSEISMEPLELSTTSHDGTFELSDVWTSGDLPVIMEQGRTPSPGPTQAWALTSRRPDGSQNFLETISPYSPIGLLNFSLDSNILADHLRKIYNTILTACSSSFLSYGCNIFSTGRRYWFEDSTQLKPSVTFEMESDIFGALTEGGQSPLWMEKSLRGHFTGGSTPHAFDCMRTDNATTRDIMHRMTPLGVVRFLDHFGDIYDNKLDSTDHERSNTVIKGLLHAFSTEWMASARSNSSITGMRDDGIESSGSTALGIAELRLITDLGSKAYLETWYKARSSLLRYRSIKSF
jgi:hypothetical protein